MLSKVAADRREFKEGLVEVQKERNEELEGIPAASGGRHEEPRGISEALEGIPKLSASRRGHEASGRKPEASQGLAKVLLCKFKVGHI